MQKETGKDNGKPLKTESPQESTEEKIEVHFVPFDSAEEVWFWFIQAQQASLDGARIVAGASLTPRPCEPADILNILNRLYKNRMLLWDHMLVLRHYGRRQMVPDARHVKEARAHKLWGQAMMRLEPVLMRRGIMREKKRLESWIEEAEVYSNDTK
jgi:hypothetical protein